MATLKNQHKVKFLKKVFEAWKNINHSQRSFHFRLSKLLTLRAKNLFKLVLSNWSSYTKKREKHRKKLQISACFYLRSLYKKAFTYGLKRHTQLALKSRQFSYHLTLKTAGDCLQKWRKDFCYCNVLRQIDLMHKQHLKQACFKQILKATQMQKSLREMHNNTVGFVMSRLERVKGNVMKVLKENWEEGMRQRQREEKVGEKYERRVKGMNYSGFKKLYWLICVKYKSCLF
jgi:hypothetical protein